MFVHMHNNTNLSPVTAAVFAAITTYGPSCIYLASASLYVSRIELMPQVPKLSYSYKPALVPQVCASNSR